MIMLNVLVGFTITKMRLQALAPIMFGRKLCKGNQEFSLQQTPTSSDHGLCKVRKKSKYSKASLVNV